MALNLTYTITADGSQAKQENAAVEAGLQRLQKSAQGLGPAMQQAGRQTSIFGQSIESLERKGSAASSVMGALTGTFGKFTAAGIAVNIVNRLTGELAGLVDKGIRLGPVQQSFERLSASVSQNAGEMMQAMRRGTQGMVSDLDLMMASNKAVLLGLPVTAKEMGELAQTARTLGKAMGLDATQAFDNLITALGRTSPLILDNLGLTVKLEDANKKYAAALGKTADELTEAEKKMAFYKAAMDAARQRTEDLGQTSLTASEFVKRAWTAVSDVIASAVSKANIEIGNLISTTAQAAQDTGTFFSRWFGGGLRSTLTGSSFVTGAMASAVQSTAPPTPQAAPVSRTDVQILADMAVKYRALTAAQLAEIAAARALGKDMDELATKYGLTGKALDFFTKQSKDGATTLQQQATAMIGRINKEADARNDLQLWVGKNQMALNEFSTELANHQLDIQMRKLDATTAAWGRLYKLANAEIDPLKSRSIAEIFKANKVMLPGERMIPLEPSLLDKLLGSGAQGSAGAGIGGLLSSTLMATFTGGGNVSRSVGGAVGGQLAGGLLKTAIGKSIGSAIGGIGGSIVPVLGNIVGAWVGGKIGGMFGETDYEKNAKTAQQDLAKLQQQLKATYGDMDSARRMADLLGISFNQAFFDRGSEFTKLDELQKFMGGLDEKTQALDAALQRYGLTWLDLGDKFQQAAIDSQVKVLIEDFALLNGNGADTNKLLEAMAPRINEVFQAAQKTGSELPFAMKPMLNSMMQLGLLVDESGQAITDLGQVKFAETLTQGFDRVIDAINRVAKALGYVFDEFDGKEININTNFSTSGSAPSVPDFPTSDAETFHRGGPIGWRVAHTGGLGPDEFPIIAQRGEYMMRRSAVAKYGKNFMDSVNSGKAGGGTVIVQIGPRELARTLMPAIADEVKHLRLN
jgi:hypothetical protein